MREGRKDKITQDKITPLALLMWVNNNGWRKFEMLPSSHESNPIAIALLCTCTLSSDAAAVLYLLTCICSNIFFFGFN